MMETCTRTLYFGIPKQLEYHKCKHFRVYGLIGVQNVSFHQAQHINKTVQLKLSPRGLNCDHEPCVNVHQDNRSCSQEKNSDQQQAQEDMVDNNEYKYTFGSKDKNRHHSLVKIKINLTICMSHEQVYLLVLLPYQSLVVFQKHVRRTMLEI